MDVETLPCSVYNKDNLRRFRSAHLGDEPLRHDHQRAGSRRRKLFLCRLWEPQLHKKIRGCPPEQHMLYFGIDYR